MITVAGLTPSLDITYVVDELRLGEIHRPLEAIRCAGGKPLNCARVAAALGAEVAVVAVLGGFIGDALGEALAGAGVGVTTVPTPVETRVCVSIASLQAGTLTEVYEYAAPLPPAVWTDFQAALVATATGRGGWLVISGGPPRDLPVDALADLVRAGPALGLRVAVDTHGPALRPAVAAGPDLVKINRGEAAELLGRPIDTELPALAEAIRERGAATVVLTDGSADALVLADGDAWRVRVPGVHGTFGVGSGDAFLGGLLAEVDRGGSILTAARVAAAAGAANALVPGPGRLDPEVVRDLTEAVLVAPW